MKQRLGIAEVLIKEPKVLLLDEPTLGLDPDGALRLIDLIQSLNRDKKITVLVSSHNLYQVQKISLQAFLLQNHKAADNTSSYINRYIYNYHHGQLF